MSRGDVTDLDKHIGARIREARKERNVSSSDLAEAIGYSEKQLSRYELGRNKLSAAQIFKISFLLGLPTSWFYLGYTGSEIPNQPLATGEPREYEKGLITEQLQMLQSMWPNLKPAQRDAILKLLDSYK